MLGVDLGSGTSVHQEVLVHLGVAQTTETGLVVPVAWQATGRKRLFPTFTGELEASEADDGTRLRLHGTYTVPLGVIGRVGNGVVGWRLACRSLDALLAGLGRQLEVEVDRRRATRRPSRSRRSGNTPRSTSADSARSSSARNRGRRVVVGRSQRPRPLPPPVSPMAANSVPTPGPTTGGSSSDPGATDGSSAQPNSAVTRMTTPTIDSSSVVDDPVGDQRQGDGER